MILIIVFSALGLTIFFYNADDGETWIKGGEIKHVLTAYYDDDTTGEITLNKPIFTISYTDRNILNIKYTLLGKIDGESIKINISDYNIIFNIFNSDGIIVNNLTIISNGFIIDTIDGEFVILMEKTININDLISEDFFNGDYFIRINPNGFIKYYMNGGWRISNLPSILGFSVHKSGIDEIQLVYLDWSNDIEFFSE